MQKLEAAKASACDVEGRPPKVANVMGDETKKDIMSVVTLQQKVIFR